MNAAVSHKRRKLLGRVELNDRVEDEIERTGLLDVCFRRTRADATLLSDDGNRTVAWVSPSGSVAAILVQDYANDENRTIPFSFGDIELVNDGAEISIFVIASEPRGGGSHPTGRRRSRS